MVFGSRWHLSGHRIATDDHARHQQIGDATCIWNGVCVPAPPDMNACARCHGCVQGAFVAQSHAENILERPVPRDMTPIPANHDDKLAFVIELLQDPWLLDWPFGSNHRRGIADEKTGILRQVRTVLVFRVAVLVVHADAPELLRRQDWRKQLQIANHAVGRLAGRGSGRLYPATGNQAPQVREVPPDTPCQIDHAVRRSNAIARLTVQQIAQRAHQKALQFLVTSDGGPRRGFHPSGNLTSSRFGKRKSHD